MQTDVFLASFVPALESTFVNRVWFCGLQGSRLRNENREDSDIDMVVVLDRLSAIDIHSYRQMLCRLPWADLACGFLSGKSDILAWDPADLFHLCMDTAPLIGSLDEIWALVDVNAMKRSAWTGICNVYHGCVHNMIYKRSDSTLRGLLKSAAFVLRAIACIRIGKYPRTLRDLRIYSPDQDDTFLSLCEDAQFGRELPFDSTSDILFQWARTMLDERAWE